MTAGMILPALVAAPAALAGLCLLARSPRALLVGGALATGGLALAALAAAALACVHGPLSCAGGWFYLDALSAYHLAILMAVFTICAGFAIVYFREEVASGVFGLKLARRYHALWFGSLAAMDLVLVTNNLGLMWVGVEATTLLTAFLICTHATPASLEAMWKYLLMCSVGVAVAFAGILLLGATAASALPGGDALLWTRLMNPAIVLNPRLVKIAFIFLVVGFGTKAGLAPLHNWLPDAHSQAPAPVSAMFSGILLNTALYSILRCLPLVERATGGTGWGREILVVFGVLSVLVAAAFIIAQQDIKRLLAYSSVENMGIIALGVGLGGAGVFAALFHTLNNSLCKSIAFCCAGRIGQHYGSLDMRRLRGVAQASPIWGGGLCVALLALIGTAPFALFLSEFLLVRAAWDRGVYWPLGLLLFGLGVVFIGVLRKAMAMAWEPAAAPPPPYRAQAGERLLVVLPLLALLALGFWLPHPLRAVLAHASAILGAGR